MIRVHVAAEKSISSAMEDRNVGKKFEHDFDRADSDCKFAPGLDVQYQWISWRDMRKFYGKEIEMKNIL